MVTAIDKTLPTVVFSEENSGRFKVGYVALNNPRALNALDLGMLRSMEDKLLEWRQDEDLACVVLYAESEKAFCAGGDVKSLVMALQRDGTIAAAQGLLHHGVFCRLSHPRLSQTYPLLGGRHYHGRRYRHHERRGVSRRD